MGRWRRRLGTNALLKVDLRDPDLLEKLQRPPKDNKPVALHVAQGEEKAELRLESSPCRFGGRRPWLVCDGCAGRRLVLYKLPNAFIWRCRRCLRLTYPSQRVSRDLPGTAQLRLTRLCRRFEPDWQYGDDYPEKPRYVRWKTWEHFCQAVENCHDLMEWDLYLSLRRFGIVPPGEE